MINKLVFIFCFSVLIPFSFLAQFNAISYNKYPYIKSKNRAEKYGSYFKKQILKLKRINPNALVLVIGPADMAKKQKTKLITYPILEDAVSYTHLTLPTKA